MKFLMTLLFLLATFSTASAQQDYVPPEGCTCVIHWFETESNILPAVCDSYGDFPHWCYVSNDESCGQKIQIEGHEIFYADCVEKTACVTTNDVMCINEFVYDGKTYNGCTTDGNNMFNTTPWCPTALVNGEHSSTSNDYGWCEMTTCDLSTTVVTTNPSPTPTPMPTSPPSLTEEVPTPLPTPQPTADPSVQPTTETTLDPTVDPTSEPTSEPTTQPTREPTHEPTTQSPTHEPTREPTTDPTTEPTLGYLMFDQNEYLKEDVSVSTPVDTTVLTVSATDEDSTSANSDLVYTFVGGNDDGHWKIDSSTGEIKVVGPLSGTMVEYFLMVEVRNQVAPHLYGVADVTITLYQDLCLDICPPIETDWTEQYSCEEVSGQKETSIYFCAEIMGHPQYRIIEGSVDQDDVTFSMFIPHQLNIQRISFVGAENAERDSAGYYDPSEIDAGKPWGYWSLTDNECHDILTFEGPLADLENGLAHFQVKDGYMIFMLKTDANQDVKDIDGKTHIRIETFVSSASILLETDLNAEVPFTTYTRIVAEFVDSQFTQKIPQFFNDTFIVPIEYKLKIKHTNGVEVDLTSITIDETTLVPCWYTQEPTQDPSEQPTPTPTVTVTSEPPTPTVPATTEQPTPTPTVTVTSEPPTPTALCMDDNSANAWVATYTCEFLEISGWCTDPSYAKDMHARCPLTCGICECTDDPEWIDSQHGDGSLGCENVAQDPSMCTDYGTYSTVASIACPVTCGTCTVNDRRKLQVGRRSLAYWGDHENASSYEASSTFDYGTVYASASTNTCASDLEWCETELSVVIIKSDCKIDENLKVGFNLINGKDPYHFEDSYRVIADTCPVQFTGTVKPNGVITFYDKDPASADAVEVSGYYSDEILYGKLGIDAHGNSIITSSVVITKMEIMASTGDVIELKSDSTDCIDEDTAGQTDTYDDGCEFYTRKPSYCGSFDDSDFTASELCCACAELYVPLNDGSTSSSQHFSIDIGTVQWVTKVFDRVVDYYGTDFTYYNYYDNELEHAVPGVTHTLIVEFTVTYEDTWGNQIPTRRRLMKMLDGRKNLNANSQFHLYSNANPGLSKQIIDE